MSTTALKKGITDDLTSMFLLVMLGAGVYVVAQFAKKKT